MPRGKLQMSVEKVEPQAQEDNSMGGFPEHGDEFIETQNDPGDSNDTPEPNAQEPPERQAPAKTALEIRLEAIEAENAELKKRIPPVQPKAPAAEADPEPDWETLMFKDPREAMRLHGERITKQVTTQLRGEYQREQGHATFWSEFYAANPDLKDDKDLVQVTLNSNLSSLANVPTKKAMEQLAELTRDRILRYSGKAPGSKPKPKARAEGAASPTPKPAPAPASNVTSISSLVKARKAKRASAA